MATIVYRPSEDEKASKWSCSSGSNLYAMINEIVADDDATYIKGAKITSATVDNGGGLCSIVGAPERQFSGRVRLISAKPSYRMRLTSYADKVDVHISMYVSFHVGEASYQLLACQHDYRPTNTEYITMEKVNTTNIYAGSSGGTSNHVDISSIDIPDLSQVKCEFVISYGGTKGSIKNDDVELRVTQAYLELTYEEVSEPQTGPGIYLKQNGAYTQANAIWKKTNGIWTKTDKSTIDESKKYKLVQ